MTKQKKKFTLPAYWCVAITAENKSVIDGWRNKVTESNEGYVRWNGHWALYKPKKFTELTFEQFKQYVLKKKEVVGYRLIKQEYKEAVNILTNHHEDFEFFVDNILEPNTYEANKLRRAGVLDLWFEPVYETTLEQKIVEFMSNKGFEVSPSFAVELLELINKK